MKETEENHVSSNIQWKKLVSKGPPNEVCNSRLNFLRKIMCFGTLSTDCCNIPSIERYL